MNLTKWGVLWGALCGLLLDRDFVWSGLVGALLGALAGSSLRVALRNEGLERTITPPPEPKAMPEPPLSPLSPARAAPSATPNPSPHTAAWAGAIHIAGNVGSAGNMGSAQNAYLQGVYPNSPTIHMDWKAIPHAYQDTPMRPQHGADDAALPAPAHAPQAWARAATVAAMPTGAPTVVAETSTEAELWSDMPAQQTKASRAPTPWLHDADADTPTLWQRLLGANIIVQVGLAILFLGLSFLVRYAAQAGLFPVELRLAMVGAVGMALLVLGVHQRKARVAFGLSLQGAGVAVLYLVVFAAARLYALIPFSAAFVMMLLVCLGGCALAVMQNALLLAMLAFTGGYAVPVLLSSQSGNYVGLWSYYAMLNCALLLIAWQHAWRRLNLLGAVATFGMFSLWVSSAYTPDKLSRSLPFLLAFVGIFSMAAMLYARRVASNLRHTVDNTLVFGTPLLSFGLLTVMVRHIDMANAYGALGFAAWYLLLWQVMRQQPQARYGLLSESFLALGVGFATLAVPLALNAQWTSCIWALEGAAAFWAGMRQSRWMPRAGGLLLVMLASGLYLIRLLLPGLAPFVAETPLAHPLWMGAMLLAVPWLLLAHWARHPLPLSTSTWGRWWQKNWERRLSTPAFFAAFAFWCMGWFSETMRSMPADSGSAWSVAVFSDSTAHYLRAVVVTASAAVALWWGQRLQWAAPQWPARAILPVLFVLWLVQTAHNAYVLQWPGIAIWPLLLALHIWSLRRMQPDTALAPPLWLLRLHGASAWLAALLLGNMLKHLFHSSQLQHTDWALLRWPVVTTLTLFALVRWAAGTPPTGTAPTHRSLRWPLTNYAQAYYWWAALPLAVMSGAGAVVMACYASGATLGLPYVPLLNPIDITVVLALATILHWQRTVVQAQPIMPPAWEMLTHDGFWWRLGAAAFIAITTLWLRVAHHYLGVGWSRAELFASFAVQTGCAIVWTLLALGLMLRAHAQQHRTLWLCGAGLLGLVVLKLLMVDLSNSGGLERIVAFMAVGILMLVVGYLVPLPPKENHMHAKHPL